MASIRIENLTKSYFVRGRAVALFDHFNLAIGSQEFVGIYGPAQSGKTTLLNLIAGLEKADAGRICVDEVDITQLDDTALSRFRRQRFGLVSGQSPLLASRTAVENIEIALLFHHPVEPQRHVQAEELLRRVGAYEQRSVKTADLPEEIKYRVLIAKNLMNRPDILLSDALADGLRTSSTEALMQLLRQLARQGMTVLLSTRSLDIAQQTDRLIHLQRVETD